MSSTPGKLVSNHRWQECADEHADWDKHMQQEYADDSRMPPGQRPKIMEMGM